MTAALSLRNLSKTFGGAKALDGVAFEVAPGEVHGLLGHNGSGKSTLVKVLAGVHDPDPGAHLTLNGRDVPMPMPAGAFRALGLSFVHQNLGLVPSLSVLENLRVADITAMNRVHINWGVERAAAAEALQRFGIAIDPATRIADLSLGDRALVAIVRAFEELRHSGTAGIIVLDEPTPFLPRASVDRLFSLIRDVVARGASVVFISHDIDEILEITHRATVLRDGRVAGTVDTSRATREQIIDLIVGHALVKTARNAPTGAPATAAVVRALRDHRLTGADFTIGKGEVLGITGLIGSGFERVAGLLFGADRAAGGTIEIDGVALPLAEMTPRAAVAHKIALLPADRNYASGVGSLPAADNMLLPDLARFFRGGRLDRGGLVRHAAQLAHKYEVRPPDPTLKLSAFSGGNAQKVLLAKWLNIAPRLLLLDEPTQGVDVGSREQVYAAIRKATAHGTAVLCASSDHEQLADLCDRVLIFARGRIVAELGGAELTKDRIAAACYSGSVEAA